MPGELVTGLLIGLVIVGANVFALVKSPRVTAPIRILTMIVNVTAACFSLMGFAGSFEPGDYHVVWRCLFVAVFVACAAGTARILFTKNDKQRVNDGD